MTKNRDKLDLLAQALLDHETLEQNEAYAAAGIQSATTAPTASRCEHAVPGAAGRVVMFGPQWTNTTATSQRRRSLAMSSNNQPGTPSRSRA